ncbi:hypothetical protein [Streptomyces sp. NPDC001070]
MDSGWFGAKVLSSIRNGNQDWVVALRGGQYRITGTVDVRQKAAISYRVQVYKDWNFDYGDTFAGIDFAPFARLHEAGLAGEFDVYGTTGLLSYGG